MGALDHGAASLAVTVAQSLAVTVAQSARRVSPGCKVHPAELNGIVCRA
jgi:hypothetical protein